MKIGKGKNYVGLGDIIAKAKTTKVIAKALGIKDDCNGCKKRQAFFNKIKIPFDRPIEIRQKEKDTSV